MYRFLATPRWLGLAALTVLLALVMVRLGEWQLHRYHERSAVNARIDAGYAGPTRPVGEAMRSPLGTGRRVGPAPSAGAEWARVKITGRYDESHELLARDRTVDSTVGYEVLTPLLLPDGSAVVVDRGFLPHPPGADALAKPRVPAAPSGEVTVVGPVRRPESGADRPVAGTVKRVSPARLGLPYPTYGGFVVLDEQVPKADAAFTPIPADHQDAWQNAGYVVNWWAFALMALVGFVILARREAHPPVERTDRDTMVAA